MGNIKYVLMAISICLSVFSSCLLRSFSNKKLASNSGDLFLFNAALSVVWAVVLGIWYLASSDSGASPMAFAFGAAFDAEYFPDGIGIGGVAAYAPDGVRGVDDGPA